MNARERRPGKAASPEVPCEKAVRGATPIMWEPRVFDPHSHVQALHSSPAEILLLRALVLKFSLAKRRFPVDDISHPN